MADEAAPTISVDALIREHVTPNQDVWRVELRITEASGHKSRFTAWVPLADGDYAHAVERAKEELHRVSSRIAEAGGTVDPASSEPASEAPLGRRRGRTIAEMAADHDARKGNPLA
ncbi:hypothetical protein MKK75_03110 [Methylobacterium sp. J-030]|uniref:hypothetical protein n=1 Tax=Methylobacterium sp. J-030 TaxID=2836627 RepID=UPI001FBAA609|nr:hypothetical protein [Methylobacterium sp. J-030]MCJ2067805.1 hypothetical protein [Methylobacterium sp. J-030]